MTEEEYFRKNYPDSCYGDKPLSPYWDFFQDGVEFGERQSEKKIEELKAQIEKMINEIDKTMCLSNMREREIYDIQQIFRKYDFRRDSNDKWEIKEND